MKVLVTIQAVREAVREARKQGRVVGLVPTMGALHQGHLSLVQQACRECSFVIVSIFVNPTQFGPREDFAVYPRSLSADCELLKREQVDVVFAPSVEEMYVPKADTWVEIPSLSRVWEGRFRPGHFRGVCTIVAKLFNIVQPDFAYFGWKDAQQLIIIRKMVEELNYPIVIVGCPTVREKSGLACSSRNVFLSPKERAIAPAIYQSLKIIQDMVKSKGITQAKKLILAARKFLKNYPQIKIQYLAAIELQTLRPVKKVGPGVLIVVAVKLGKVRLIDNLLLT
ncbi:MAG: pantoate--beta-alanine ligase [Candidatus Omnitrophica bacterium]|nr:pantoate--beta-alanine ligase [Candidatus Omnitrophota bacterium]